VDHLGDGADVTVLQQILAALGSGTNSDAASIWTKLGNGEWFTLESATSPITGAKNSTSASKIGTGATSAVAFKKGNGLDVTPNALFRATTLPWTPANSTSYSIGCWVNADSIANVVPLMVGETNTQNGFDRVLQLFMLSTGAVIARAGDNSSSFVDASTPTSTVTTGTTYFLQGERKNGVHVRVRVNNGTWAYAGTALTANTAPTSPLGISIGADYNSSTSTVLNAFDGRIDEAFVIPDFLTDSEWDYLYAAGAGKSFAELQTDSGH
jgi:hypothetical protein